MKTWVMGGKRRFNSRWDHGLGAYIIIKEKGEVKYHVPEFPLFVFPNLAKLREHQNKPGLERPEIFITLKDTSFL